MALIYFLTPCSIQHSFFVALDRTSDNAAWNDPIARLECCRWCRRWLSDFAVASASTRCHDLFDENSGHGGQSEKVDMGRLGQAVCRWGSAYDFQCMVRRHRHRVHGI